MTELSLDEQQMKALLKEAVLEALQERRDLFYEVISEVMEDLALAKAIAEGESCPSVTKEEILRNL